MPPPFVLKTLQRGTPVQCPNCSHWNEDGANFCEECGEELKGIERASKPISLRSASKPVVDANPIPNAVPTPAPQDLAPAESLPATPYTGARLVLSNGGSIFRL